MGFGKHDFGTVPFGTGNPDEGETPSGVDKTKYDSFHANPPHDGSPRDLALNQFKDIFFATNGDLAVVNGRQNIQQSVAIDVMNETDVQIGKRMSPTQVGLIESAIRNSLQQDPQVSEVVRVKASTYNTDKDQLNFDVDVIANDGYEISLVNLDDTYTSEFTVRHEQYEGTYNADEQRDSPYIGEGSSDSHPTVGNHREHTPKEEPFWKTQDSSTSSDDLESDPRITNIMG